MTPNHTDSPHVPDTQCTCNLGRWPGGPEWDPDCPRHGRYAEPDLCTCSKYNAHLLNLLHWEPDPNCPRHGDRNANEGDPNLDIDTSYLQEEGD